MTQSVRGVPEWIIAACWLTVPAIMLIFFGQALGFFPSRFRENQDLILHNQTKILVNLLEHRQRQEALVKTLSTTVLLLCENSARTHDDRQRCMTRIPSPPKEMDH
jgi:hypothetical protein